MRILWIAVSSLVTRDCVILGDCNVKPVKLESFEVQIWLSPFSLA